MIGKRQPNASFVQVPPSTERPSMTAPRDDSPTRRLTLTTTAFRDGEPIPMRHTCDGEDESPPLAWTGVPVETRSFALICDDPDAPRGTWVHWLLWNLPADVVEVKPGMPPSPELSSGARQGLNDGGDLGYGGPCPPPGKPHRYFFRLFALDAVLGLAPGTDRSGLEAAMKGHVLAEGAVMGIYERRRR
jgi:Raf kinase inhibitor-like YbhB/YbcL family protein